VYRSYRWCQDFHGLNGGFAGFFPLNQAMRPVNSPTLTRASAWPLGPSNPARSNTEAGRAKAGGKASWSSRRSVPPS